MSTYKRAWLFTLVFYGLGLGSFLVIVPEAISSGEWFLAAILITFPALFLAYLVNGTVEVWKAIVARKHKQPESKWTVAARARNCYCGVWDTDPEAYRKLGYARGTCGVCERCGSPGHTRHFPGPVPYTGEWCDRCFRILAWTWPFRSWYGWGLITAVVLISLPFWRPMGAAIKGLLK